MRTAIPTDLLLRLMNATPEQYAAVRRILGCAVNEELDAAREDGDSANHSTTAEVAQAAFALMVKLDARGKQKAPTPLTVFRHYCIEGLSAEQVATKCRCSKGTVMGRLRLIERVTRKKPESFRAMSDHLQRLDDNYTHTGAREVYRRGLVDDTAETDS
jgi:hypothetical protein